MNILNEVSSKAQALLFIITLLVDATFFYSKKIATIIKN